LFPSHDPQETYAQIEEMCTNRGISFSQYFLELHEISQESDKILNEIVEEEEPQPEPKKGKKKQ